MLKQRQGNKKTSVFIICLLIASVLWLFSKFSQDYNLSVEIPFAIVDVPKDTKVVLLSDSFLRVHVQDNGFDLIPIGLFGVSQTLDIPFSQLKLVQDKRDSDVYYLEPTLLGKAITQEYGFDILNFEHQDSLLITTERLVQKKVPIIIPLDIEWASQTQLAEPISMSPDSLIIYGNKSQIDTIEAVSTAFQYFTNLQHSVDREIGLHIPKGIRVSHRQVRLKIQTEAFTETALSIPIDTPWDSVGNVRVFPSEVLVRFAVPLSVYKHISVQQFKVHGNIDSAKSGQLSIHIQQQPNKIRILSVEPQTAEFIFVK